MGTRVTMPSLAIFLFLEFRFEIALRLIDEGLIFPRANKGIAARIGFQRRDLVVEVKERAVRGEKYLARKRLEVSERCAVVFDDARVIWVVDQFVPGYAGAAKEDNVVAVPVLFGLGSPGGATLGVSGSKVRGHGRAADGDGVAVSNNPIGCYRRICELVAPGKVAVPAARELRSVFAAGNELGPGPLFELGEAARVVEMRMAVEQIPHISDFESELADIVADHRRGFDHAAIEKNVSARASDQIGGKIARADVIDVANYAKWLDGLVPGTPRRIGLARRVDCR